MLKDFYKELSKGVIIPKNVSTYNDNVARQVKEDKKRLDRFKSDIDSLVKIGFTPEIAKAISTKYYQNIKHKMKLINAVNKRIEVKIVTVNW